MLEFGTSGCGYCRAARPLIDQALARRSGVRHLKIEDGKGRALGRHYGVKLWPTLVLLRNGRELRKLIRPDSAATVAEALAVFEQTP